MSERYTRLTVAAKQARELDQMREPDVTCPRCETKTTAADLVAHVEERCTGPRDAHPRSRWIPRTEALRFVPKRTLYRWARTGRVRQRCDGRGHREYLLRDVTRNLALRRAR